MSEVKVEAGDSATLTCKLAQAQTQVTWYKDGKKLSSSSKVRVEASGSTRRLVVQQAGKEDAGEYSCEAGGQKISFHLNISGQFFVDSKFPSLIEILRLTNNPEGPWCCCITPPHQSPCLSGLAMWQEWEGCE